jgi:hypothetical protein
MGAIISRLDIIATEFNRPLEMKLEMKFLIVFGKITKIFASLKMLLPS